MKFLIFITFFFFTNSFFAQNLDSINFLPNQKNALSHFNNKNYQKALELFKVNFNYLESFDEKLNEFNTAIFQYKYSYLTYLKGCTINLGKYEEAIDYSKKELFYYKQLYDTLNKDYTAKYAELSSLNYQIKKYKQAIKYETLALNINRTIFGENSKEHLMSLYNLSIFYFHNLDYNKSINMTLEYLKNIEKTKEINDENNVVLILNLSTSFSKVNDFKSSIIYKEKSIKLVEKIYGKESSIYIKLLSSLQYDYQNIGDNQRALEIIFECLKLQEVSLIKDTIEYQNTLKDIYILFYKIGDYQKAIDFTIKCLNYLVEIGVKDNEEYILSLGNLALFYQNSGDYIKSIDISLKCLNLKEKIFGKENPTYIATLGNLALCYSEIGEYSKALEINLESLKCQEKISGKENQGYSITLGNLSIVYSNIGDHKKAIATIKECLNIQEKVFGVESEYYTNSLANSAVFHSYVGNNQLAIETMLKCVKIQEKIQSTSDPNYLKSLGVLAVLYGNDNNYKCAIELFLKCLESEEKILGKEHPDFIITKANLACSYAGNKNYKKAIELNLETLEQIERIYGKKHHYYLWSLKNLSLFYININKIKKADSVLNIMQSIILSQIKFSFIGFDEKLKMKLKNKFLDQFFYISNYLLKNDLPNKDVINYSYSIWLNLNGILNVQSSSLKQQINLSNDSILILKYQELINKKNNLIENPENNIEDNIEDNINSIERFLSSKVDGLGDINKIYYFNDIKNQLNDNEVFVDIIRLPYIDFNNVTSDSLIYFAYVITKETKEHPTIVKLNFGNSLENIFIKNYKSNIYNKNKLNNDTLSFNVFWRSISDVIGNKNKIYISSSGIYNDINYETLYNPKKGKYLGDENEIHLVASGRFFILSHTKTPIEYKSTSAYLVGYPNYDAKINYQIDNNLFSKTKSSDIVDSLVRGGFTAKPLPYTKIEINEIEKSFLLNNWQVTKLMDEKASEAEIKKILSPRVLHIATHGFFLSSNKVAEYTSKEFMGLNKIKVIDNPLLRSGLFLAGANRTLKNLDTSYSSDNGILTAYEASLLNLTNTELVVLSACETGKGDNINSEGIYGLRKSFSDAGAKNIIMSLWKIDDKVTQEFMTLFYENWLKGISIYQAFRKTQSTIRETYPNPYYWGAFVLIEH